MTSAETPPINWSQHFLIAMPGMEDPGFARSVVYICEHNEHGALGLCINKSLGISLSELFEQIQAPLKRDDLQDQAVCWGGPVHSERGFILHPQHEKAPGDDPAPDDDTSHATHWDYASTLRTPDGLQMTTSRDIIEALSEGSGPAQLFAALGYSSWGKGQLEDEVRHNSWLTVPADRTLIFDTPLDMRYTRAIELLGFDPGNLTLQSGTA